MSTMLWNILSPRKQTVNQIQKVLMDGSGNPFMSQYLNNDDTRNNTVKNVLSKSLDQTKSPSDMGEEERIITAFPATTQQNTDHPIKKKNMNPLNTSVILFPGQGMIKVGRIKEYMRFPKVKELFSIANEVLGYNLQKLCLNGPQKVLDRTEFNQPATVVSSLAALEKLQEERPRAIESCVSVAGFSVGELTALIFSGAIPYEEGLKLVGVRATAMQNASEMSSQGMLSCYCTASSRISEICRQAENWARDIGASNPLCRIAVHLHCQGKVFGGCHEALQYIEKNSRNLGLRRVKRLTVSGAYHTQLMGPALASFSRALSVTSFEEPNIHVYSNFSADPYLANTDLMKKFLMKQIVSPVQWEQILHKIYERPSGAAFPRTFDVGSGGAMKILLKMTNHKAAESCYVY